MTAKVAAQAIVNDVPGKDIDRVDLEQLNNLVNGYLQIHGVIEARARHIIQWQKEIDGLQALIDNANAQP